MAKKYVLALLLAVVFLGVFYALTSTQQRVDTTVYTKHHVFYVEQSTSGGPDVIVRGRKIGFVRNDAPLLVRAFNKSVEDEEFARPSGDGGKADAPKITLRKIENGTAFVEIANDQYLTRQMGSSGAQDYLATATYTLTENPGIKAVDFQFPAGDHAMPGIYTRESFTAYTIVREKKT